MNMRRTFVTLLAITVCLLVLIMQLAVLQLFRSNHYGSRGLNLTAASVYQREHGVVLDDGRGRITDRFGHRLTSYTEPVLAVIPAKARMWLESGSAGESLEQLLKMLGMDQEEWVQLVKSSEHIVMWERDGQPVALNELQQKLVSAIDDAGLAVVPYTSRYRPPYIAAHVIGYMSQHPERVKQLYEKEWLEGSIGLDTKLGASGLERTFERELRSRGLVAFTLFTDALDRPLDGLDRRILDTHDSFYPVQVVTTLDMELQTRVERLLDERQITDASVVLLDPRNADVRVMANRPNYDPTKPNPHQQHWANRATQQQIPGSIFKLVIAAAALEYNVTRLQEQYFCPGEYGKYGFSCWKSGGHGKISFQEAFAQSCNVTFAEAAKRLTPQQIEHTAWKLGIGRTIGWAGQSSRNHEQLVQFDHEESGQVFQSLEQVDEGILIQSAIGQRDVRMTPMQAANVIVTLLNGGYLTSPRIVSEVRFRDGALKRKFPEHREAAPGISRSTAQQLLRMMSQTVRSGTAQSLRRHDIQLAGKTGTAETGRSGHTVHQWFVGYGPVDEPQIAGSIVVYDAPAAGTSNQAVELFAEIMDIVQEVEQARQQRQ